MATEALINHDLARQPALAAARWRDREIQREIVRNLSDPDMDISLL